MNHLSRSLTYSLSFFQRTALAPLEVHGHQMQWIRGIRVKVFNDNLEQALNVLERKMKSSGMERLIKRHTDHHVKNSEKRVLARKNLELRIRSEELSRKLRSILVKKISTFSISFNMVEYLTSTEP
ncbi:uncharacterized protein LOC110103743 isoform X1 [Dendrobium catenatum]|uniref:Uncharacterized protein n=1 Tax=Dendrobium catenatum TaxID=906689 RepID=A0A2I0VAX3_9ASPA|nr:uncharacterized protein LOC110103743 isoform X1 [Dendrobium catenatum]XP_020688219.1 uncharacterized protein LOC110103743 isoform X1 [Dendrobium catenatum]PKU60562.1 hypothetical protein MA16_Dca024654 [Dendrobium catenatum]